MHLSHQQREVFAGWKRPHELVPKPDGGSDSATSSFKTTGSGNHDLVQDVLTDCSVVASLCATTARAERGQGKLQLLPVSYPHDEEAAKPRPSPSGKYVFSFYFNGCFRKVVIDNRLPSSMTPRSLHVIDRNNPHFLWPALVEKAYLKVRGGYDFPGSNSGTDLWVLTGWIPEQVFLHHEDVTSDQIWKRLATAFHFGDVMLTVGTGKLTETEQTGLGLVSEHDYAILDMKESKGRRRWLVKNPWAGTGTEPEDAADASQISPGTFWMDCDKVFQNFENLYLNWNPGLFKFREDMHFTWDLANKRGAPGCFVNNPQFKVYSPTGGAVWLLLGKHFRTDNMESSSSDDSRHANGGFISIYVFKAEGRKVILSDGAAHRGPYVDSPNTLMRLDMPPSATYTAVISEESLPPLKQNFTFSVLSTSCVELTPAQDGYVYETHAAGSWSPSTAGGNAESPRYPLNPQFSLTASAETDISILLECANPELAAHIKLFWSKGKRIATVRPRDVVESSGDYRRACALIEKKSLMNGIYTVVCSTFAPDQLGQFTLRVWSNASCELKPLAAEDAGRRTALSDLGVLAPGRDRMLAPLRVTRLARVKLIAHSRQATIGDRTVGPSPILMTVELGQGPYKEVLASSEGGVHSDAIGGIRIEDFDLHPGLEDRGVSLVIERIGGPGGQVEDQFDVEALSEERVEIGEWIVD